MDRGLYFFIRTGITASMFISNPIHTTSQCELVITMVVPNIMVSKIMAKVPAESKLLLRICNSACTSHRRTW